MAKIAMPIGRMRDSDARNVLMVFPNKGIKKPHNDRFFNQKIVGNIGVLNAKKSTR